GNGAGLVGLKVDRIVIIPFVVTGAACGLSGLIDSSMTGSGTSDTSGLGGGLALLAIAGVALGGTSIFGGVGSVWRTVLGVLILGMITNGFDLLAVPDSWQNIVPGILIIFAVAISTMIERRLAVAIGASASLIAGAPALVEECVGGLVVRADLGQATGGHLGGQGRTSSPRRVQRAAYLALLAL